MFKNALALNNSSSQGSSKLPENWTKDHSRLIITLDRPCALNHVDLMVGDLHPNGVRGWGKVSIGIRKSGPDVNWFTGRINIPPQGVINGTPKLNQNQLQAGDEIVISADRDTVYLMAARFACD
jgi:hypothetical protein